MNLGVGSVHQKCSQYSTNCKYCWRLLLWPRGIFCTNYAWSLRGFPSCREAWCRKCYSLSNKERFFVQNDDRVVHETVAADERKVNLWKQKSPDLKQFQEVRKGEYLFSPFVCHICLFIILQSQDIDLDGAADHLLEATLIQAILNVFWSRACSTVSKKIYCYSRYKMIEGKRFDGIILWFWTTPFLNIFGIEALVLVLSDSQGVGRYYADHEQWNSSTKVKSEIANFEKICYDSIWSRLSLVDEEKGHTKRFYFEGTSSLWYYRFANRCQARMGKTIDNIWYLVLIYGNKFLQHASYRLQIVFLLMKVQNG